MALVRATTITDWQALREIRLQALRDAPYAFASTHTREAAFGARLILQLLSLAVKGEEGHERSSGTFNYRRRQRSCDELVIRRQKEANRCAVLCFFYDGTDFGWNEDTR